MGVAFWRLPSFVLVTVTCVSAMQTEREDEAEKDLSCGVAFSLLCSFMFPMTIELSPVSVQKY